MTVAWRDPSIAAPWYPITSLTRAGVSVELALEGGFEVIGRIVRHPKTGRPCWYVLSPSGRSWSLLAPWRPYDPEKPPRYREPKYWRPLPWVKWPDPLPEPVGHFPPTPPPPAPEPEPPPFPETDDWPYPGLALGERVPPQSLEETEARVLRALRRLECEPRVGVRASSLASDIPAEIILAARRLQDAINAYEAFRQGRMGALDLPPARVAWTPTRRDHGDWEYALEWLRHLPRFEQQLFRYRAANPVFSWRQISEREGLSVTALRQKYQRAIETMYRIATEGSRA